MAGNHDKIRTGYLPNTNPERYAAKTSADILRSLKKQVRCQLYLFASTLTIASATRHTTGMYSDRCKLTTARFDV
jgi:hypothetical protein